MGTSVAQRQFSASVIHNSAVVLIGGYNPVTSTVLNTVNALGGTIYANLPTAVYDARAVFAAVQPGGSNFFFVFGGYSTFGSLSSLVSSVRRFDVSAKKWTSPIDLPSGGIRNPYFVTRYRFCSSDAIVVAGGIDSNGQRTLRTDLLLFGATASDPLQWVRGPDMIPLPQGLPEGCIQGTMTSQDQLEAYALCDRSDSPPHLQRLKLQIEDR